MTPHNEIGAKAQALLRETIELAGLYRSKRRIEQKRRIKEDVGLHWHLMLPEARSGLSKAFGGARAVTVVKVKF